ncbi:lamin tail domain-containing protein [bacterium]|nr:lamin tail domain-containing protein [bacterium]
MLNRFLNVFLTLSVVSSFLLADVFMTELTDPQNSSDAGRYVELYNNGDEDVDLSAGWALQRWTNGNADPQSAEALTGTIAAGGFYIVCNNADKYNATYGLTCDQDFGTGDAADSNGDDNIALLGVDGSVVDVFGVPGEDGSGTWHEFEDGRAERAVGVISGCVTPDLCEVEWIVDNDSGGGDGEQYAPEGFDPGAWIGATSGPDHIVIVGPGMTYSPMDLVVEPGETVQWVLEGGFHDVDGITNNLTGEAWNNPEDFYIPATNEVGVMGEFTFNIPGLYGYDCSVGNHAAMGMVGTIAVEGDIQLPCEDPAACNYLAYEDCTYIADGDCDCDGNVEDCLGDCGGSAVVDNCGICGGDDTSCATQICVSVDMRFAEVGEAGMKARTSTVNDEYSPSDWVAMDYNPDGEFYEICLTVFPGNTYGYNFNNNINGGYESGDDLDGVCASGNYGNDRIVVVPDDTIEPLVLDTVCWESCDACPEVIEGCTDENALNYDETATDDDGSCFYDWPESDRLFFSEHAEGTSYNKYFEIYNASDSDVDLSNYSYVNCSNACDDWEYTTSFADGAVIAAGDVYAVCHSSFAGDQSLCDESVTLYHNGNDAQGLKHISGEILDVIGVVGDPNLGAGWEVDGIENATVNHTLVRKAWVQSGNPLWLDNVDVDGNVVECGSAGGVNAGCDSEWIVLEENDWTFLGFHDMDNSGGDDCGAEGDINNDDVINILDIVALVNGIVGGYDVDCGDLNGDGVINILDIVAIVNIITSGRTTDATSAMLNNENSTVSLSADGYIGGVQMTLTHGNDFTIELTDNCMASNYVNHGNYTTLVVVEPNSELLFTANGTFDIKDVIVANSENEINVSMINEFSLSAAYPNPFNPNTSFDVSIPTAGYLSVKVYDLSGKLVNTIANGIYNQNNYTFTWDASGMPSGMYVINAEFNNSSISHNISLIK